MSGLTQHIHQKIRANFNFTIRPQGIEMVIPNRWIFSRLTVMGKVWSVFGLIVCNTLTCLVLIVVFRPTLFHFPEQAFWITLFQGLLGIIPVFGVEAIVLYEFFGNEHMTFLQGELIVRRALFGLTIRKAHYQMRNIKDVQFAPQNGDDYGYLLFTYEMPGGECHTITCGKTIHHTGIDNARGTRLVTHLAEILKFHCHIVERIVFGSSFTMHHAPYTTLHNPDVLELTFPFVHLKQVCIHTDTYEFHQVERFLTYAVNYIGQEYLKTQVTVHLYGDTAQLHPNLRNSVTNLCRSVQIHTRQEEPYINAPKENGTIQST